MDPNYCLKYEYLLAIVNPSKNCNVKKVIFESGSMKRVTIGYQWYVIRNTYDFGTNFSAPKIIHSRLFPVRWKPKRRYKRY